MANNPILQIPNDIKIFHFATSVNWIDANGILCSVSKPSVVRSLPVVMQNFCELRKMLRGKKIGMLKDVTNIVLGGRHLHDYVARELPEFVEALALISNSPLGTMVAKLFMVLENHPYPVKLFSNEAEARVWLNTKIKVAAL